MDSLNSAGGRAFRPYLTPSPPSQPPAQVSICKLGGGFSPESCEALGVLRPFVVSEGFPGDFFSVSSSSSSSSAAAAAAPPCFLRALPAKQKYVISSQTWHIKAHDGEDPWAVAALEPGCTSFVGSLRFYLEKKVATGWTVLQAKPATQVHLTSSGNPARIFRQALSFQKTEEEKKDKSPCHVRLRVELMSRDCSVLASDCTESFQCITRHAKDFEMPEHGKSVEVLEEIGKQTLKVLLSQQISTVQKLRESFNSLMPKANGNVSSGSGGASSETRRRLLLVEPWLKLSIKRRKDSSHHEFREFTCGDGRTTLIFNQQMGCVGVKKRQGRHWPNSVADESLILEAMQSAVSNPDHYRTDVVDESPRLSEEMLIHAHSRYCEYIMRHRKSMGLESKPQPNDIASVRSKIMAAVERSKNHESIEQLTAELKEVLRKQDMQSVGISPCTHRPPPLTTVKSEALGPIFSKVNPPAEVASGAAVKLESFPSLPDSHDLANPIGEESMLPSSQTSLSSLPTPPLSQEKQATNAVLPSTLQIPQGKLSDASLSLPPEQQRKNKDVSPSENAHKQDLAPALPNTQELPQLQDYDDGLLPQSQTSISLLQTPPCESQEIDENEQVRNSIKRPRLDSGQIPVNQKS